MDICASESFDVVLSDVNMPGMDGHGLVRWVSETYPQTRSILMSALEIQCGECPFRGRCKLLRKPFSPTDAVSLIGELLHGSAH